MSKKYYIVPTMELFDLETEQIIATSPTNPEIGPGDGEVGGGDVLTNKRQPIGGTWDSENWKRVEE